MTARLAWFTFRSRVGRPVPWCAFAIGLLAAAGGDDAWRDGVALWFLPLAAVALADGHAVLWRERGLHELVASMPPPIVARRAAELAGSAWSGLLAAVIAWFGALRHGATLSEAATLVGGAGLVVACVPVGAAFARCVAWRPAVWFAPVALLVAQGVLAPADAEAGAPALAPFPVLDDGVSLVAHGVVIGAVVLIALAVALRPGS